MNIPSYYKLPRDKRYLVSDEQGFPYTIGGRATDVTQLAASVMQLVKDGYPINAVPQEQIARLDELMACALRMEVLIETTIEDVCVDALKHVI